MLSIINSPAAAAVARVSGHRNHRRIDLARPSSSSAAELLRFPTDGKSVSSFSSSCMMSQLHPSRNLVCQASSPPSAADASYRKDEEPGHGVLEKIVGVLGGGQLGRMMCKAASQMAIKVVILDPMENCPASSLSHYHMVGSYNDSATVEEFAKRCQVLTVEIEHVDADTLEKLENQGVDCQPKAFTIRIIQVYEGSVYLHQGKTYMVKSLDLSSKIALCQEADLKYYTKTRDYTDVHVIGGNIFVPVGNFSSPLKK